MSVRVSGKNLDLGDVLKVQAESRVNETVAKYVEGGFSGHVTVSRDGIGFRTECTVHLDHGPVLHVTGEAGDAYQSLGLAVERIAKQLRRFKRRKVRHGGNGHAEEFPAGAEPVDEGEEAEDVVETAGSGALIVAEAVEHAPVHSLTTAVAAFEAGKAAVLVFRNAGTRRINVLYRRADSHFGWVDIG